MAYMFGLDILYQAFCLFVCWVILFTPFITLVVSSLFMHDGGFFPRLGVGVLKMYTTMSCYVYGLNHPEVILFIYLLLLIKKILHY